MKDHGNSIFEQELKACGSYVEHLRGMSDMSSALVRCQMFL